MGSTRLPGKVLMKLAGQPMLGRVYRRAQRAATLDEVVVATTLCEEDQSIADFCHSRGWPCFRGSKDDVLDRFYRAAVEHNAFAVVRITADCPLIDPDVIDMVVRQFHEHQPLVHHATTFQPQRSFPRGLDVEVTRMDALTQAWREARKPAWREHVTPYVYRRPDIFRVHNVLDDHDRSQLRWTVDTPKDWEFVSRIYDCFEDDFFSWRDVLDVLKRHPTWAQINNEVEQEAHGLPVAGRCLVIRADGNSAMGLGHVMRCLALGQAWQKRGGMCWFVSRDIPPPLVRRLGDEDIPLKWLNREPGSSDDARETIRFAQDQTAAWVVVDGYHLTSNYVQAIKRSGLRVVSVDDRETVERVTADVVVNQNIYASEALYPNREPYTSLLLGTRYAMLRDEFGRWRDWRREIAPVARRVLLTMGGSDSDNLTLKVIGALEQMGLEGLEVVALVGASNPHSAELQSVVERSAMEIRLDRDPVDVSTLMAWADVAVTAAGSTCWEVAFMGLPSVTLVLADNQERIAQGLSESGAAHSLGHHDCLPASRIAETVRSLIADMGWRQEMSAKAKTLVDGLGSRRIVDELESLSGVFAPV